MEEQIRLVRLQDRRSFDLDSVCDVVVDIPILWPQS